MSVIGSLGILGYAVFIGRCFALLIYPDLPPRRPRSDRHTLDAE